MADVVAEPRDLIREEDAAERLSVSPEELLALSIEEKLAQLNVEFHRASDYVLTKNAELYKRLA